MRKKIEISIDKKKYIVGEPTVALYWLSLEEPEQFISDLFLEYNSDVPKLSSIEVTNLLQNLFEIEENVISKILDKNVKEPEKENKINNFHIVVGQFMKFYGNGFEDTLKIPFRIFQKMLKDIKVISGEKELEDDGNKKEGPDKQKLKSLLSKFS